MTVGESGNLNRRESTSVDVLDWVETLGLGYEGKEEEEK